MSYRIDGNYVPPPPPPKPPEKPKKIEAPENTVANTTKTDESVLRGNSIRFQVEKKMMARDETGSDRAATTTDKAIKEAQDAQETLKRIQNDPALNRSPQIRKMESQEQWEIVNQKQSDARQAIENEVKTYSLENGDTHQAIARRAGEIAARSPENKAFQSTIREAEQNVHVAKAKQAVEMAYNSKGGAAEAARVLREQTEQVSPKTAAQILSANKPVLDKIISDLNSRAKEVDGSYKLKGSDILGNNLPDKISFDQTLSDLAAAAGKAAKTPDGKQLLSEIAQPIVDHIKQEGIDRYDEALGKTIAYGGGTDLAVEVMNQLQTSGKTSEADDIMQNVRDGVNELKDDLKGSLKDYAKSSEEFEWLVQNEGSLMDSKQLQNAINGYKKDHPELGQKFDALDKMSGYAVCAVNQLSNLPANLQTLGHYDDAQKSVQDFLGDETVQKAITTMPSAVNEFKKLVELDTQGKPTVLSKLPDIAGHIKDGQDFLERMSKVLIKATVSSAIEARLTGNTAKASQIIDNLKKYSGTLQVDQTKLDAAVNRLKFLPTVPANQVQAELKSLNKDLDDLGGPFSNSQPIGKLFRGAGVLLSIPGTIDSIKNISDPLSAARALTDAVGLSKDSAELFASFYSNGRVAGIVNSTAFEIGGKILGGVGIALDGVSLIDDVTGKDKNAVNAGFDLAKIGGGAAILLGGGPITIGAGAVVLIGSSIAKAIYGKTQEANKHENDTTKKFLQDGGVTNEAVAHQLTNQDSDGRSPLPVFAQLAKQFDKTPQQFLSYLNGLSADKVKALVEKAHGVDPDDKGVYPATADNDFFVSGKDLPNYGNQYGGQPAYYYDRTPHSINGLRIWMQANGYQQP